MGKSQRSKGARGQREAAKYLNAILPPGYVAENAARNGVTGGEDVIVYRLGEATVSGNGVTTRTPLPISIEVKRDAQVRLGTQALEAACEQARSRNPRWMVLWRGDGEAWRITVPVNNETDAGIAGTITGEAAHRAIVKLILAFC